MRVTIKRSLEGFFARERNCFPQRRATQATKRLWLGKRRMRMAVVNGEDTAMQLVVVKTRRKWSLCCMDVITGTLYDAWSGRCYSSSHLAMDPTSIRKAPQDVERYLITSTASAGGYPMPKKALENYLCDMGIEPIGQDAHGTKWFEDEIKQLADKLKATASSKSSN